MKTLKIFIVLAIVAIGLICGKSEPSLKGVVKDVISGNGLSKATVTVLQNKKIIEKVKTSSTGYFQVQNLSDGSYSLKTECSGYAPDVRNFSVISGKTSSLIISLSPEVIKEQEAQEKSKKNVKNLGLLMVVEKLVPKKTGILQLQAWLLLHMIMMVFLNLLILKVTIK